MVEPRIVSRDATVISVLKSSRTDVPCLPQLVIASLFVIGMCSAGGMDISDTAKLSTVGKDSAVSWTRSYSNGPGGGAKFDLNCRNRSTTSGSFATSPLDKLVKAVSGSSFRDFFWLFGGRAVTAFCKASSWVFTAASSVMSASWCVVIAASKLVVTSVKFLSVSPDADATE